MGKTESVAYKKRERLKLVKEDNRGLKTSSLSLPKDLPSVEEALQMFE